MLFYEDEAGNKPVEIFIDKLDDSASKNKREIYETYLW